MFVNATLDEVAGTADRARLTLLQPRWRGPAYCAEAARRTGCKVMKAVRVKDAAQVRGLRAFHTDYHLLDAYAPRTPGGTGETFNWEPPGCTRARRRSCSPGSLNPDNVGEAIAVARRSRSIRRAAPRRRQPQGPGARARAFFRAAEAAHARRHELPADRLRRFGPYGGRYVPETLIPALDELERAWLEDARRPRAPGEELSLLRDYAGRPTPLYRARRLSKAAGSEV